MMITGLAFLEQTGGGDTLSAFYFSFFVTEGKTNLSLFPLSLSSTVTMALGC